MAAGDSYGASLAASSSSGANQSGATSQKGGGNFGGTSYGPGSLLLTDQRGSIGASATGAAQWIPLVLAAAVAFGLGWFLYRRAN